MKDLILICKASDRDSMGALCEKLEDYLTRKGEVDICIRSEEPDASDVTSLVAERATGGQVICRRNGETVTVCAENMTLLWVAVQLLLRDGQLPVPTEAEILLSLSACTAKNWKLPFPAYTAGELKERLYNCGFGKCEDEIPSVMQVVGDTTEVAFLYYVEQLKRMGYEAVFENSIDGNRYVNFFDILGNNLYVYYMCEMGARSGVVRAILDRSSVPLSQFCYTAEGPVKSKLYYFHHVHYGGHIALIHCADNSWIFIDGEYVGPDSTVDPDGAYADELLEFMRERSGLGEDERVVISCWCVSHLDCDHFYGFWSLIKKHHRHIDLRRTMFNPPNREVAHHQCHMVAFRQCMDLVNSCYPDLMHLKTHPGQQVQIANVSFTVLHSQDPVGEFWTDKREVFCETWSGWWPLYRADKTNPTNLYYRSNAKKYDFNNSSTVYRIEIDGLTLLEMGDAFRADAWVVPYYSLETLTTDTVVLAHHFFNDELHPFYWSLIRQGRPWYALITAAEYECAGEKLDMLNACDSEKGQRIFTSKFDTTFALSKPNGNVLIEEIPAKAGVPYQTR